MAPLALYIQSGSSIADVICFFLFSPKPAHSAGFLLVVCPNNETARHREMAGVVDRAVGCRCALSFLRAAATRLSAAANRGVARRIGFAGAHQLQEEKCQLESKRCDVHFQSPRFWSSREQLPPVMAPF